jgi:hypothetical protein
VRARRAAAAIALAAAAGAAPVAGAAALAVVDEAGTVVLRVPLAADGRWCLVWNHSVAGFEVTDCFRAELGRMVLERSHQPDFAAGLGDIPGRGTVRADGNGGYWIEGIDAAVPASGLPLRRAGAAVDQRIRTGGRTVPLPPGRQGERLTLRLEDDAP